MPDENDLKPSENQVEINGIKVPVDQIDLEKELDMSGGLFGSSESPAVPGEFDWDEHESSIIEDIEGDFLDPDSSDCDPDSIDVDDDMTNFEQFRESSQDHDPVDLSSIWTMLKTPIYTMTEHGHQLSRIRHIAGGCWLEKFNFNPSDEGLPEFLILGWDDLIEYDTGSLFELDPNQEP